jgi:glycosyltransferase involved in cell wall biosynthesis
VLHDAAVFDHPEAYRPAFVAWYRWLFRRLVRRAAVLLTVSRFARGRLVARLGPAAEHLLVVPNGADHLVGVAPDPSVLDRLRIRGQVFLLAVGSANPTKNLDALVVAHGLLGPGAPPLVIAGGTRGHVFSGAAASGPGVLRAGPVDDAALVALYRHARALVFPSVYEGFGLPLVEAMGQGCPVVASRTASIPEVCGDAALYLDGTDAPAIADGLRRILADAALHAGLRQAGLQRAAQFRWSDAAAALLKALRRAGARP